MKTITIPVRYEYTEHFIPPRCRKERTRDANGMTTLELRSVARDEAPIAAMHLQCWFPRKKFYRYYDGKFYSRSVSDRAMEHGAYKTLTDLKKSLNRRYVCCYERQHNEADAIDQAKHAADSYLVVDGELWEVVGEPRYNIATFGLGWNHASTALMIENHYNSNVRGDYYFSALDRKNAVKSALAVAKGRGDTNSLDHIRNSWEIHVYMPEVFKFNPATDTGPGDSFLNTLNDITASAGDVMTSGLLVMCAANAAIND